MSPAPLSPKTRRHWLPQHPLFRLMAVNGLAGAGLGILFVICILALDVAAIRTMLVNGGEWVVGLALLTVGSITTFASVAMGGAIMLMRYPPDHGPGGRHGKLIPVRVHRQTRRSAPPRLWTD